MSDAMVLAPSAGLGVQAAEANGSWPLHQVALEGYTLEVFPAATPTNELLGLCIDPEAVSACRRALYVYASHDVVRSSRTTNGTAGCWAASP